MDRLWWENITNTSHFIDQIVEAVQSGSHLFLQLPQFVPWYETMSDLVISKIERQNSDRSLKIIMDSGKDPGEYLFYQYCRQEKRAQYRPGIGYAQFLAKSEELIDKNKAVKIPMNSGNNLLFFGEVTQTPYGRFPLYPKMSKKDMKALEDSEERIVEIKKYRE